MQIVILALTTDAETVANTWSQFTLLRNRGGIVNPSRSVIMICKETEKCYQWMHLEINYHRPNILYQLSVHLYWQRLGWIAYHVLKTTCLIPTPHNIQVFNLIKCICSSYHTITMHYLAKQKTVQSTRPIIHKQLTKFVLCKLHW